MHRSLDPNPRRFDQLRSRKGLLVQVFFKGQVAGDMDMDFIALVPPVIENFLPLLEWNDPFRCAGSTVTKRFP